MTPSIASTYDEGDETVVGRDGIVAAWLEDTDNPDAWEATYEAWAVDVRGVGVGTSRYLATADKPERTYYNCFLMKFADDGRCSGSPRILRPAPGPRAARLSSRSSRFTTATFRRYLDHARVLSRLQHGPIFGCQTASLAQVPQSPMGPITQPDRGSERGGSIAW